MAEELDAFLKGGEKPEPAPVAEPPAAEPAQAEAAAPEPDAEADDDLPLDGRATIPVEALQAERAKRRDWRDKFTQAEVAKATLAAEKTAWEGERTRLLAQLEELKKAPAAPTATPTAQAPPPIPNPAEDPNGYTAWQAQAMFDQRLNLTEDLLREKEGDEAVDAAVTEFKAMVAKDPTIYAKFQAAKNPYRWMFQEVKRAKVAAEVGADPEAWRAAERERIRAELAAETATPAATPAPAPVVLPQSLSAARTAAPRNAPVFTGPVPLETLFPQR